MDTKRKSNNESVKKSRNKKKKEIEDKAKLHEDLARKAIEIEQVLSDQKDEIKKIQTLLFNSKQEKRDFTFVKDGRNFIEYFELEKLEEEVKKNQKNQKNGQT